MIGILNWLQIGTGAVVGAMVGGAFFYAVGHWQGHTAGYDQRVAEVAAASAKAELERKGDDATIQKLSDYDLCVLALDGRGLPDDPCQQLLGLRGE